mmetsp:Transcript_108131/g.131925  ORF Transcript_108131/g.131925 Transcript_108131/m.131925 type:complete len:133 (-) Transcript_108131:46-444(-)|eukprot:CAMPEP_0114649648 /NCGR_PEP_ID=MMETSP0191-20121206/7186_1 /TAXON_ID=126664 /ORGANISM="Sorites sp." /LENGTH=132 /DNA_ID=CAMNT_0001863337 /DNA_START=38 /DNA_END=436 /DNA_ORIENTATION=+
MKGLVSLLVSFLPLALAGPKALGHVNGLSGKCFESEGSGFSCDAGPGVVVWDPDAPCGAGKAYIHAAPNAGTAPMTAGAGPTVHKYFSATVTNAESFASSVGKCAQSPVATGPATSWQVADLSRGGKCTAEE